MTINKNTTNQAPIQFKIGKRRAPSLKFNTVIASAFCEAIQNNASNSDN